MRAAAHAARRPCASRAAPRRARSAQRSRPAAESSPAVSAPAGRGAGAAGGDAFDVRGAVVDRRRPGRAAPRRRPPARAAARRRPEWECRTAQSVAASAGALAARPAVQLGRCVERSVRRRLGRGRWRRCWNIGWRVGSVGGSAPSSARNAATAARRRSAARCRGSPAAIGAPHGLAAHATHRTPVRPDRGVGDLVGRCAVRTDNLHRAVDGSSLAIRGGPALAATLAAVR